MPSFLRLESNKTKSRLCKMIVLLNQSIVRQEFGYTIPTLCFDTGLRTSTPYIIDSTGKRFAAVIQTPPAKLVCVEPEKVVVQLPEKELGFLMEGIASFFSEHSEEMFEGRKFAKPFILARMSWPVDGQVECIVDAEETVYVNQFDELTSAQTGDVVACVVLFQELRFSKRNVQPVFRLIQARKHDPQMVPNLRSALEKINKSLQALEPDDQSEAQIDDQTVAQTNAQIDEKSVAQIDDQTDAHIDDQTVAQIDAQLDAQPVAQTDDQTVAQIVTQPDAQTVAQTDDQSVAQTAAQIDAQTDDQSVAQTVAQIVTQPDAQPDAQIDDQSDEKAASFY
jgi:hypothetical protein